MRFENPLALLLLAGLGWIGWQGWPRSGPGQAREAAALVLRVTISLALILALAELNLVSRVDRLAVVFLLDRSDSVSPRARQAEVDYVRQALKQMGPDDQAAVVAFGGDALVERRMSPGAELGEINSTPIGGQTDLGRAVRLGMALFPAEASRRMVILSDGMSTEGDALSAARLAASSGVQLDTVRTGEPPEAEALVSRVAAPRFLQQGERFDLQISLYATRATDVAIQVLEDGQPVYSGQHALAAGDQSFSLSLDAGAPGYHRLQVQIAPQGDRYYQNNELSTFIQVAGPPRVLVVAPPPGEPLGFNGERRPDEAVQLVQALKAAQFSVDTAVPTDLASNIVDLTPYSSLLLVDVPARELNQRQMEMVQSYVRDLGGGLVAVGGPTSYGVGGYFRTPLEETLPVEMQLKDQKRRPSLAMVFIIDHSGSMTETSGGPMKLELAKEAAIRSVDLLFPTDRVGVIAFDDAAGWVVPMTELSEPKAVQNAIAGIRAGGGTDILAGLQAMAKILPNDPASVKHVVLLTDGGADPTGIPELVTRLHDKNGITLTTVGVGRDAASFLPDLARLGGGRYHFAADPGSIPSIFTEETSLVSRSYIVEHSFFPEQSASSPILAGIQSAPQLQGYVATTAKEAAQTILISDQRDPILAAWQYGLGRAVAFTSDATGRWARGWLDWDRFTSFWGQVVRSTIRDRSPTALDVSVLPPVEGAGSARLVVEARVPGQENEYLNGYRMQARVVGPDGNVETVELRQTAPGEYSAGFNPAVPGVYLIGVTGGQENSGGTAVGETVGWVMDYSAEYRNLEGDPRALERIAGLAGGRQLSLADGGKNVFDHNLPAAQANHPAWPWLLGLAALLLPLDIAVRRLLLSPRELLSIPGVILRRLRRPKTAAGERPRTERLEALFQAKQRAARVEDRPGEQPGAQVFVPGDEKPVQAVPPQKDRAERESKVPQPSSGGQTTAASLLAAKREREKRK
ncbi:MAG TPA: VWA domain-containing protein [Anaerolineaceae bacterium]|nr:VWA domain-containing protein [Anaerolineaceae bacterium]